MSTSDDLGYQHIALELLKEWEAEGVVLIVFGGIHGNGVAHHVHATTAAQAADMTERQAAVIIGIFENLLKRPIDARNVKELPSIEDDEPKH
jgi:hypothetical protein